MAVCGVRDDVGDDVGGFWSKVGGAIKGAAKGAIKAVPGGAIATAAAEGAMNEFGGKKKRKPKTAAAAPAADREKALAAKAARYERLLKRSLERKQAAPQAKPFYKRPEIMIPVAIVTAVAATKLAKGRR
jgi:hypothetical protein